jgi:hypothetical protein
MPAERARPKAVDAPRSATQHGCMPGGIVAAIAERISAEPVHEPRITLTYDGFADKVNPEHVPDLAEQVRHREK